MDKPIPNNKPNMPKFNMNWLYIFVIIALTVMFFAGGNGLIASSAGVERDYTTFKQYIAKGTARKWLSTEATTPSVCTSVLTISATSSDKGRRKWEKLLT